MIKGIGSDFIDAGRLTSAIEKNPRFLPRNFTPSEIRLFEERHFNAYTIATNFAIKEAVSKALGTGFRGFNLIDVEVLRDNLGKPYVELHNGAKRRAEEIKSTSIHATSSHDKGFVVAYCIIEGV